MAWAKFTVKTHGLSSSKTGKAAPATLIKNHIGDRLIEMMVNIKKSLGDHFVSNPLEPEPAPKKIKLGGNPDAFIDWMRAWLKSNRSNAKELSL